MCMHSCTYIQSPQICSATTVPTESCHPPACYKCIPNYTYMSIYALSLPIYICKYIQSPQICSADTVPTGSCPHPARHTCIHIYSCICIYTLSLHIYMYGDMYIYTFNFSCIRIYVYVYRAPKYAVLIPSLLGLAIIPLLPALCDEPVEYLLEEVTLQHMQHTATHSNTL